MLGSGRLLPGGIVNTDDGAEFLTVSVAIHLPDGRVGIRLALDDTWVVLNPEGARELADSLVAASHAVDAQSN
jgi:hypothetical protein